MFFSAVMEYVIVRSEDYVGSEVPVFAVVAIEDEIVSESFNDVESSNKPWCHAEFLAIEKAHKKLKTRYLDNASLYVNLEPCAFCAAMIEKTRLKNIFFGAYDPKCGGIEHNSRLFDHSLIQPHIIGGIQEARCSKIISNFFQILRNRG